MATQKFKAEFTKKVQELFQFVREEYPECDYFSVGYMNHDHEPKAEGYKDTVSVFMTVRPEGVYAREDSDYQEDDPAIEREDGFTLSWNRVVD